MPRHLARRLALWLVCVGGEACLAAWCQLALLSPACAAQPPSIPSGGFSPPAVSYGQPVDPPSLSAELPAPRRPPADSCPATTVQSQAQAVPVASYSAYPSPAGGPPPFPPPALPSPSSIPPRGRITGASALRNQPLSCAAIGGLGPGGQLGPTAVPASLAMPAPAVGANLAAGSTDPIEQHLPGPTWPAQGPGTPLPAHVCVASSLRRHSPRRIFGAV